MTRRERRHACQWIKTLRSKAPGCVCMCLVRWFCSVDFKSIKVFASLMLIECCSSAREHTHLCVCVCVWGWVWWIWSQGSRGRTLISLLKERSTLHRLEQFAHGDVFLRTCTHARRCTAGGLCWRFSASGLQQNCVGYAYIVALLCGPLMCARAYCIFVTLVIVAKWYWLFNWWYLESWV